jgi:MinD superfamily P-loop ATPase
MIELTVLSGKGGTGKTSVLASLAVLAGDAVLADCDVDAPDLHLVLEPRLIRRHDFVTGRQAHVDAHACTACGECVARCRFGAITCALSRPAVVDPLACEGCGVCTRVCPEHAVGMHPRRAGDWMVSRTRCGPMVHARLEPGGSSSGHLVSQVRMEARRMARLEQRSRILIDGPPGVGCPVIASLTGATHALVVTEPTPAGEHDMVRVLELAAHFNVPIAVCVNRWDLYPAAADALEQQAAARGANLAGRIAYDPGVTRAQLAMSAVVEHPGRAADDITTLWDRLCHLWPDLVAARGPDPAPATAAADRTGLR